LDVRADPVEEVDESLGRRAPARRERVLDARRDHRMARAHDQAVAFEHVDRAAAEILGLSEMLPKVPAST
jgi:hypothetical protein